MTIDYDPNDTRTMEQYRNTPKADAGDIFTCWPLVEIKSGKLPYLECRSCGLGIVAAIATLSETGDELVKCGHCGEIFRYHYTPAHKWL